MGMNNKTAKKKVDPERLRAAVKKRGMMISEAGTKCGRCSSFITNFCRRKEIPTTNIPLLEERLGIPYEEYCPVPKESAEKHILNEKDTHGIVEGLLSIFANQGIEIDFEIKGHISGKGKS